VLLLACPAAAPRDEVSQAPSERLIVATPSGNVTVLVRAQIPAGFALSETFLTQEPCFVPGYGLGSGRLVATPGGQITAHCFIRA
jgi:hypothetical protein